MSVEEQHAGPPNAAARHIVDSIYRTESRRVFATLVRLLGDFDLAEEAMHDAFASAMEQWGPDGVPTNPRAWLISTARFKAIDALRRKSRFDESMGQIAQRLESQSRENSMPDLEGIEDDRLRLIFTCCHPALPQDAVVPLTLREVCGLSTEEIAHAFLTATPTVAQRIVRAKAKIKAAKIPYQVPSRADMPERLEGVLTVIYLVFNEGYSASSGDSVVRPDLSGEAIRLGRLLMELLPDPEVVGLVALMLLQESRHRARMTESGEIILLEDQDRTLWNRQQIDEGLQLVDESLSSRRVGPYSLQAAIAAVHAQSESADKTDWAQIVALYTLLLRIEASPVIELNCAVAVAMRDGPEAGLRLIDEVMTRGDLGEYHLAYAAKAELSRRAGKTGDARIAYEKAISLAKQEPEKRFLTGRLRTLPASN
jgi:RNA polymerase sigma-70 factor (ECF subfamily)